jgi:hypothetical protein
MSNATVLVRKPPDGVAQPCLVSMVHYAMQIGYQVIDQEELNLVRAGLKTDVVEGEILKPEPVHSPPSVLAVEMTPEEAREAGLVASANAAAAKAKSKGGARAIRVGGL